NWSMHDLRHTCALRMVRDKNLSLRDVQAILGHAHLTTTQIYLEEDDHEVITRVQEHLAQQEERAAAAPPPVAVGYDAADLAVLFGGGRGRPERSRRAAVRAKGSVTFQTLHICGTGSLGLGVSIICRRRPFWTGCCRHRSSVR